MKYLSLEEYIDYTFHTQSEIDIILDKHKCFNVLTKNNWLKNNGYMQYQIHDNALSIVESYPYIHKVFDSNIEPIKYFSDCIGEKIFHTKQPIHLSISYDTVCTSEHYITSIEFSVDKKNEVYVCKLHVQYDPVYTEETNVTLSYVSIFPQVCAAAALTEFMKSDHHSKSTVWDILTKNV